MKVTVTSFGFKHGPPPPAEFVFDCRALPNPYSNKALRYTDGTHKGVHDWLWRSQRTEEYVLTIERVLEQGLGKTGHAVVAFGCIGGFHRSVALAEHIGAVLEDDNHTVEIVHRDVEIGRWKCRNLPRSKG